MKKRSLLLAIVLLIVCATSITLCACNKTKKADYDYLVTFDYNYGNIDANCPTQYLGVKKNSLVGIKPTPESKTFTQGTVTGYYLEGWYTAQVDSEGKPVVDEVTNMVKLDKKWDFETMRVNSDITLYANLLRIPTISFVDRATKQEVLKYNTWDPTTVINRLSDALAPKKDNYTLYDYYVAETGDERFVWPFTVGTEDKTIYVEFIEGTWDIVKTAREFKNGITNNKKIYLDADIDFSNERTLWNERAIFNGTINGNGHKVTGMKRTITFANDTKEYGGLFFALGENCNISDITFEVDATIEIDHKTKEYVVGLFANSIAAGARLKNVILKGTLNCSFNGNLNTTVTPWINTIDKGAIIENCDYSTVVVNEK